MKVSIQGICEFALTKPQNKNFIGGGKAFGCWTPSFWWKNLS